MRLLQMAGRVGQAAHARAYNDAVAYPVHHCALVPGHQSCMYSSRLVDSIGVYPAGVTMPGSI